MLTEFDSQIWRDICYKICNGEMISGNLIEYICQYFENGILGTSYIRRKGTFIYYGGN